MHDAYNHCRIGIAAIVLTSEMNEVDAEHNSYLTHVSKRRKETKKQNFAVTKLNNIMSKKCRSLQKYIDTLKNDLGICIMD